MTSITDYNKCTGCSACASICSHNAIRLVPDKYGYVLPVIDETRCVGCHLCIKTCPNNQSPIYFTPKRGYGLHTKNTEEQLTSNSGGVASTVARYIIRNGGVVYGCTNENMRHTCHIRVDNEDNLMKLKSSKYVQSDMTGIYPSVKKDLKEGKKVLFIGTPCQVAGLKSFLKKDYETLFTIDFVCHGVPSQFFVNDELDKISTKHNISGSRLLYRYKRLMTWYERKHANARKNWYTSTYGLHFVDNNGKLIYQEVFPKSRYMTGFLMGLTYRESCYSCNYARQERVSDFTCGDYYEDKTLVNDLSGYARMVSMLSVNSKRGEYLWDKVSDEFEYTERDYKKIVKDHPQLNKPMPRHRLRDIFLRLIISEGYSVAISKCTDQDSQKFIRSYRKQKIRFFIYKVPGTSLLFQNILKPLCKKIIRK